jgi:hypothetical protein
MNMHKSLPFISPLFFVTWPQLLGELGMSMVVRMALMRAPSVNSGHLHRDVTAHAWGTHRIYVPITSEQGLAMEVCVSFSGKGVMWSCTCVHSQHGTVRKGK